MSTTQSIEKAIKTMATQTSQYSPFDKTRSGIVKGYDAITNTYKVIVDGVIYNNISIVNGLGARLNDVVKVVFPNGNVSQMFIYGVQSTDSTLVGEIKPYAGKTEPDGWLICDGREVSRSTYQLLFNVIGVTYGAGDGSITFNIPDLSGRTLIGTSAQYPLADARGEKTHVLTIDETPAHAHTPVLPNYTDVGFAGLRSVSGRSGSISLAAPTSTSTKFYGFGSNNGFADVAVGRNTSSVGGGQAHNNMQPYLAINYLIYTGGTTF